FVGLGADQFQAAFLDAVSVTPLLVNGGGFETPALAAGTFKYSPTGSAWEFTSPDKDNGNGAGLTTNGSGFTGGKPAAPEGPPAAFLQQQGTISQTVNLAAGPSRLSFLAAQRAFSTPISHQTFRVEIDGAAVGTFTPADTSYRLYTTDSFTVTAGSHTIR